MNHRHLLLPLAVAASLLTLSACRKEASPEAAPATAPSAAAGETADQFVARVNAELKAAYPEQTSAQWLSSTFINDDSQRIAAKSNERALAQLNQWIEQAVSQHPEQYLWAHRRFKTRPAGEPKLYRKRGR